MLQQHRAGEKLFVDYAGATAAIESPHGLIAVRPQIAVVVLGDSCYTYAEAT